MSFICFDFLEVEQLEDDIEWCSLFLRNKFTSLGIILFEIGKSIGLNKLLTKETEKPFKNFENNNVLFHSDSPILTTFDR